MSADEQAIQFLKHCKGCIGSGRKAVVHSRKRGGGDPLAKR